MLELELDPDLLELDWLRLWLELPLAGSAGDPSRTAISSGPLTPAPKFCEIRSYAWRDVVDFESAAVSC